MKPNKYVSTMAIALVAASVSGPMLSSAVAGGYGYGNNSGGDYSYQRNRSRTHAHKVYEGSNRHLKWCYENYRSYRQTDNTFQPYHGPRKHCLSPHEAERLQLFAGRNSATREDMRRDRSAADRNSVSRDQFGNLPETAPGAEIPEDGIAAPTDRFGNLPEEANLESEANRSAEEAPLPQEDALPVPPAEPSGNAAGADTDTDDEVEAARETSGDLPPDDESPEID